MLETQELGPPKFPCHEPDPGGGVTDTCPHSWSNFFIFMQFFGKIGRHILDPPLIPDFFVAMQVNLLGLGKFTIESGADPGGLGARAPPDPSF